jgi:glycosyltransferase involved in cell wall biosynthesis
MITGPALVVDRTHVGRRASGIERITEELFSEAALAPLPVVGWDAAGSRPSMVLNQRLRIPAAALANRDKLWLFSGYPPSPWMTWLPERTVFYVHDLFLLTRQAELNRSAKLYMVRPFRTALARLRAFLTNSETTAAALRPLVRPEATILPYRPAIRNVFGLSHQGPAPAQDRPLVVGAMGTIEPRKNFVGAARLCESLGRVLKRPVELHIIGRTGWGEDAATLARQPQVRLKGFLDDAAARRTIDGFDLFLCSSHDEGLGLPLLEMQFAGLLVVAPDKPVFREVLGTSGLLVDMAEPEDAARAVADRLAEPDWHARSRADASANILRWNRQAARDRDAVMAFLAARLAALDPSAARPQVQRA